MVRWLLLHLQSEIIVCSQLLLHCLITDIMLYMALQFYLQLFEKPYFFNIKLKTVKILVYNALLHKFSPKMAQLAPKRLGECGW
jgi:hypothetical protein